MSATILWGGLALLAGLGIGFIASRFFAHRSHDRAKKSGSALLAEAEARKNAILKEAETEKEVLLLRAKEESLLAIQAAKKEEEQHRQELEARRKRLEDRETLLDTKMSHLETQRTRLEEQTEAIKTREAELASLEAQKQATLESLSGLSKEEAKEQLLALVEASAEEALESRMRKMDQISQEEIDAKSRKILSLAIERYASSQSVDTTTTAVSLPSDEMKGRIIGKEGRNIKALELLTGTEIIVDETPETITISAFSAIRRHVAKLALESLIKDGRIHPARIEEAVQEAKKELTQDIRKAGEDALYSLGIPVSSIDPKLISILGRMKYRTSYGQNVLQHSIEVAQLASIMAEELGADVFVCKKGGLFHDIGKAVDHDMQGAHPEIGYNIMKKFGFPEEMAYQSIAHHEDKPRTIEGVIVKAADAISGARPGARKNSFEQFVQRMEELEKTAASFAGIEKAYAIQAGREVRVFVHPERINDLTAYQLAQDIARKIESELSYPGEIRVTVIRETRVIEYAR